MRVLFDQGVPAPLVKLLPSHEVVTAYEAGWAALKNGELLGEAEGAGFDVFVTTDQNLRYQQNLMARKISIVVLTTTRWPRIRKHAEAIEDAIATAGQGSYLEVTVP